MLIDGQPKSYSRIYNIWRLMKRRCNNQKDPHYYIYGGRGIKVCPEWNNNSDTFIEWAYANGYTNELELDRIDPDKDYSPDNCRWVDKATNCKQKRKPYSLPQSNVKRAHKIWEESVRCGLNMEHIPEPKYDWEN